MPDLLGLNISAAVWVVFLIAYSPMFLGTALGIFFQQLRLDSKGLANALKDGQHGLAFVISLLKLGVRATLSSKIEYK